MAKQIGMETLVISRFLCAQHGQGTGTRLSKGGAG